MTAKALSTAAAATMPKQSPAESTVSVPGKNIQLAKRTYPDITREQKFWDLAVLS